MGEVKENIFSEHGIRYVTRWDKFWLLFIPAEILIDDMGFHMKIKHWQGKTYILKMWRED